ncbi:MAG: gamma-glutamylcyclotransferase [Candidatus Aureabacteria bacterium]|nr:gamma-glutamylcyclotransferase [Candidatus Auribacterota bacterium]
MYYFAYGSNMDHGQMAERCPDSRFLKRAYLKDHRFVYDGRSFSRGVSVANIVSSRGEKVWGGLFEISESDLMKLDFYEGHAHRIYDRKVVEVVDDSGTFFSSIVYIRQSQPIGTPTESYRSIVVKGARDCGLPEEYIQENLQREKPEQKESF